MDKAQVGNIISGTEWEVRAIQQRLAKECFELMVQSRVDGLATSEHAPSTVETQGNG